MNEPTHQKGWKEEIVNFLPARPGRVLDVGCGPGLLGETYKQRGATETVGIEILPDKAKQAEWRFDRVLCGDVETMQFPFETDYFDTIVCSDMLEHLHDPWAVLRRLAPLLAPDGCLLATFPNVANYIVVLSLISGSWNYADRGLMDRSHLRFFTIEGIQNLFLGAGLYPELLSYSVTPEAENLLTLIDQDQIRFAVKSMFKALNPTLDPSQLDSMDPILFYVYNYYIRGTKKSPS